MKKSIKKKVYLTFGIVFLIIFAGITVEMISTNRYNKNISEIDHIRIDTLEISEKDKEKDFMRLWDVITEGVPMIKKYPSEYNYDILSKKDRYLSLVKNADGNFEFMCTMFAILNEVPSAHTEFFFPQYDEITGYPCFASNIVSTEKSLRSMTDLWKNEFDGYSVTGNAVCFSYIDGKYYYSSGISTCDFTDSNAELVSIDGQSPDEYVLNYLSVNKIIYDYEYKKMYRALLILNDTNGEEKKLILRKKDGTEIEKTAYYNLLNEYKETYDLYYSEQTGIWDDSDYYIDNIDENTVYIEIDNFFNSSGLELYRKIREYCFKENISVILDLRNNGGGIVEYGRNNVYPVLFSDDTNDHITSYLLRSDGTRKIYNGIYGLVFRYIDEIKCLSKEKAKNAPINLGNGKYYIHDREIAYKGLNSYAPDIYILVSTNTVSAADSFVSAVSDKKCVTIIGERSRGEKDPNQVMSNLPNSMLVYKFTTGECVNSDGTDNALYGTPVDVCSRLTYQGFCKREELYMSGEDVYSLSGRLKWDDTLIKTIDIIKEKRNSSLLDS